MNAEYLRKLKARIEAINPATQMIGEGLLLETLIELLDQVAQVEDRLV